MTVSQNALTVICLIAMSLANAVSASAQSPSQSDLKIDAAGRTEVIQTLIEKLNEQYVFPDVAKTVEKELRQRASNKEYDRFTSAAEFAKTLTAELREITHDQHLSLNFSIESMPVRAKKAEPTTAEREGTRNYGEAINFGFDRVERLPANIGYIRLNLFFPPEYGADTAAAAMTFVANTEALIIDLRGNDGGSPDMNVFIASYLFGQPVHLGDIYEREGNETRQFWTLPVVPGKRYVGKDVYILTSKRTFSAAEAFTYDLKALKRVTVIGETTGGGANPRDVVRINDHFWIGLPTGRAVNPITHTNWEGTGVIPDIAVPADLALQTAQLTALKKLVAATTNDPTRINNLNKLIDTLEQELKSLQSSTAK